MIYYTIVRSNTVERQRGFQRREGGRVRARMGYRSCYHQGIKPRSWIAGDPKEDNGNGGAGNTNETDWGWERGWKVGEGEESPAGGRAGSLFGLMNEATRKLKWQLRNIISSAVKRVSRNCARGSARFVRVQQASPASTCWLPHRVSFPRPSILHPSHRDPLSAVYFRWKNCDSAAWKVHRWYSVMNRWNW